MASALISMICFGKHESLDHKKLKNKRKNGRTYKKDEHGLPCRSNSLMKSARSACEISRRTRTEIQRACEQLPLCNYATANPIWCHKMAHLTTKFNLQKERREESHLLEFVIITLNLSYNLK